MSGLCSVLDSLRQSLESDSESENDDLDPDGNSSANSHIPSWHGSLQQLPTTPSTSESEAGNMSSESHLCRQCGRARKRERARASGCSSVPPGRRLRPRIKKRAHFATDTDNSSDPERLSDSHESSLLFKPIAPSPNFMSTPLVSLSPREVKSVTFTSDIRPASTGSIPTSQMRLTRQDSSISSAPLTSGSAASRVQPPPSLDIARGRKPFKADHELFKRHPSGLPCPGPANQRGAHPSRPSSSSTASPTSPAPPSSSTHTHSSSSCGSPALPPRHPIKPNNSSHSQHHQHHHHKLHNSGQHHHHHNNHYNSKKHHHNHNNTRRYSLSGGELSEPAWDSGYGSNFTETDNTVWRGNSGGRSSSDNDDVDRRRNRPISKQGPPVAPRSASASRIGARENSRPFLHRLPPPAPSSSPSSSPASSSSLQPQTSFSSSSPLSSSLLPPTPPSLLVTPPDSPTYEQQPPPLPPPPPELQDLEEISLSFLPSQPPPPLHLLDPGQPSSTSTATQPLQHVAGTPPIHPSVRNVGHQFDRRPLREADPNPPGKKLNLQETWNIARQCSKLRPDCDTSNPSTDNNTVHTAHYSTKPVPNLDPDGDALPSMADQLLCPPPKYEDAVKRNSIFRTVVNGSLSEPSSESAADSRYVGGGQDSAIRSDAFKTVADSDTIVPNGSLNGESVLNNTLRQSSIDMSQLNKSNIKEKSPPSMQRGFVGKSVRQFEAKAVTINQVNKYNADSAYTRTSNSKNKNIENETMNGATLPPHSVPIIKTGRDSQSNIQNRYNGIESGSDVMPRLRNSLPNGRPFMPAFSREDSHVSDEVFLADEDSKDREDFADESSGSLDNTESVKRSLSKSPVVPVRPVSSGSRSIGMVDNDNSKHIIMEFLV